MFFPEVVIEEGSRDPAGRRVNVAYSEIWGLKCIFKEHSNLWKGEAKHLTKTSHPIKRPTLSKRLTCWHLFSPGNLGYPLLRGDLGPAKTQSLRVCFCIPEPESNLTKYMLVLSVASFTFTEKGDICFHCPFRNWEDKNKRWSKMAF